MLGHYVEREEEGEVGGLLNEDIHGPRLLLFHSSTTLCSYFQVVGINAQQPSEEQESTWKFV